MKKLFTIFSLLVIIIPVSSQWSQYPGASLGGALNFIQLLSNQTGYIGGNLQPQSAIFRFQFGGSSGTVLTTNTPYIFHDFRRSSSGTLFVCGTEKSILKSNASWETKHHSNGNFYAMSFPSDSTAYVVGDGADNIYKSVNAGENWSAISSPGSSVLKSVYFLDEMTGWVCGSGGLIAKTTSGGTVWINQSQASSINFEEILFINSNTGFAAGSNGTLLKTVNGGQNWAAKPSTITATINSAFYLAPNLWAAGNEGRIIKSTDTGETWSAQNTNNATVNFTDIAFYSNDTGYAVSSDGFMYRTNNSGGVIGIVNGSLPEKFELKQNYPNPFNPVTQIEYSLLKEGEVNLSVYDAAGKFIMNLVNEHQNFGTYRVSFDASGMASGVYFYRLEANGYSEMRKMLLIK